ncbi:MAG: DUF2971 domain-containing protein [Devosia sp.]
MSPPPVGQNPAISYITNDMRTEITNFRTHLIRLVGRSLPSSNILWHYTNFAGLLGILDTGSIYTTQHSCLNDSMEYLHLPRVIADELKRRIPATEDADMKSFYEAAHGELGDTDISSTGHFVACLSEDEDDLGQWRGYGGGTCGYAIGFRANDILTAIGRRSGTLLMPMEYRVEMHERIASEVINFTTTLYRHHAAGFGSAVEPFSEALLAEVASGLDVVVSCVKHHKFEFEHERRITTKLLHGEHEQLVFIQKQTLLARHLPLSLLPTETDKLLPIHKVMIGPGPAQGVTKIAVGDLLKKYGYDPSMTAKSEVPYRIP